MKRLFMITFCSIILFGCGGPSTDSQIKQGTDTGSFSGIYGGTLKLQATADVVGASPQSDNNSRVVEVAITQNGILRLKIGDAPLDGIIDNGGSWKLEIAINDFSSLIDEETKVNLKKAGCPLGKKFAKIEGKVIPPIMSGEVSGKLSCKVLLVPVGTLGVSGTLSAAKKNNS